MKENYVIVNESFDTKDGVTTVIINTNYGAFSGSVKLDDMDAEYPSMFHATELALAKAQRKFAKTMLVICREKRDAINGIIKQFWNCANPQPGSHEAQLVRKAYEEAVKEVELWQNRIENISLYIVSRIKSRDALVEKYNSKKESKD
jgi:hypothetical protein